MDDKENEQNSSNKPCDSQPREEEKPNCEEKPLSGNNAKKIRPNLMHEPFNIRPKSPIAHGKGKNIARAEPPTVYRYAEIYERKKKEMIERCLEEERKNRIFISKPAPKFNVLHEQKKKSQSTEAIKPKITIPVTPVVLKKSKEMEEKRKQMLEEYNKRSKPQKFVSRDAHVLHEEPFKPKKATQIVEPQPFNLHVEKRLEERKHFDENVKKSFEEKKKQVYDEEEERKRREEELVRELRKLTSFKARPNPFK